MRDFTRHERAALDRWLTTDPNDDGEEWCGDESVHDPHGNCPGKTFPGLPPQPATGSRFARDNDPCFEPINHGATSAQGDAEAVIGTEAPADVCTEPDRPESADGATSRAPALRDYFVGGSVLPNRRRNTDVRPEDTLAEYVQRKCLP